MGAGESSRRCPWAFMGCRGLSWAIMGIPRSPRAPMAMPWAPGRAPVGDYGHTCALVGTRAHPREPMDSRGQAHEHPSDGGAGTYGRPWATVNTRGSHQWAPVRTREHS